MDVATCHVPQRSTSLRSLVDFTSVRPPAVRLGLSITGLDAWARILRPRDLAEIGEKKCIDSTRLALVLHQQWLGHRWFATDAAPEITHHAPA